MPEISRGAFAALRLLISLFGGAFGVAMPVIVEITRLVIGVIVMGTGLFFNRLVAVTMLVEVTRSVPGMIMMLAGFFLRHANPPSGWWTKTT